jgi:hypothetical protein
MPGDPLLLEIVVLNSTLAKMLSDRSASQRVIDTVSRAPR